MKTIAVGMREFRRQLAQYIRRMESGEVRIIVMNRNTPLFEVRPVTVREFVLDEYIEEVSASRRQIAAGDVYPFPQVCNILGYDEHYIRNTVFRQFGRRTKKRPAKDG